MLDNIDIGENLEKVLVAKYVNDKVNKLNAQIDLFK